MSMFLPGAASLVEQLDKRLMIVLRCGKNLIGTMRSFDQFSNLVLEDTFERHVVNNEFGDIPLGLYIVRGDSIVLLGEIDDELGESTKTAMKKVSATHILQALRLEPPPRVFWDFE